MAEIVIRCIDCLREMRRILPASSLPIKRLAYLVSTLIQGSFLFPELHEQESSGCIWSRRRKFAAPRSSIQNIFRISCEPSCFDLSWNW